MKSFLFSIHIVCLSLMPGAPSRAEAKPGINEIGSPFIQNYSPHDYDPKAHSQNWDATQDQRGVMYFANQNGVLVFDGVHWELIQVGNNLPVRSLDVDQNSTVHIGSAGELGFLAPDASGKLIFHSLTQHIPEKHKKFGLIYHTFATEKGVMFVTNDTVYYWSGDNMSVSPIDAMAQKVGNAFCNKIYNRIYCIDYSTQTKVYVLSEGRSKDLTAHLNPKLHKLSTILPYPNGKALVFLSDGHTIIFDPNQTFHNVEGAGLMAGPPLPKQVVDYLNTNRTYRHPKFLDDRYFINTLEGGILVLDAQGWSQNVINTHAGLLNHTITSVYVDRDSNLWATSSKGLSHIEISSPISLFDTRNNLESIVISFQRHQGIMYMGSLLGVYYLPKEKLLQKNYNRNLYKIDNTRSDCFSLIKRKQALFAPLCQNGVYEIQDTIATKRLDLPFISLTSCQSSRFPDLVFLNSQEGGLAFLEFEDVRNKSRVNNLNMQCFPSAKDMQVSIAGDKYGNLWTLNQRGVLHIRFTGDSPCRHETTLYPSRDLPFAPELVRAIYDDVYISSEQGIYKINLDDIGSSEPRFVPATEIDGYRIQNVEKIKAFYAHDDDKLIGSTGKHLVILKKGKDKTFEWIDAALNKIQGEFAGIFLEPEGTIWISTSEAVFRYDSTIHKDYHSHYHALIRNVVVNNNEILFQGTSFEPGNDKRGFPRQPTIDPPIELLPTLPYEKNSIAFQYSAAFYEQPKSLRFRTRLEGYDRDWSDWSEKTYKEFTNLPEGNYRFTVQAINIFDHPSQKALYQFVIHPPWYRTILAYIGYSLLVLVSLFSGIRFNTRRLIAAKKRLEKIVNQRTRELREKKDQLEESLHVLKKTQNQLLDASWKAGMADVASGVLHNIGNALNSLNVSQNLIQDRLKDSKIINLPKISTLTKDTFTDTVEKLPDPERGMKTIEYLTQLASQLSQEHNQNIRDIQTMEDHLAVVKKLVAMQGTYIRTKNILEPVLPVDLMEIALEMSQLISNPSIRIERDYQYQDPIRVERHKVVQILVHLINNAHTSLQNQPSEKKKIILKIEKNTVDHIMFSVADNGVGFDADSLSSIFSFNLDKDFNPQDLQFHSSANAAKSMGGNLTAQSEGPGRGACFRLSLPV